MPNPPRDRTETPGPTEPLPPPDPTRELVSDTHRDLREEEPTVKRERQAVPRPREAELEVIEREAEVDAERREIRLEDLYRERQLEELEREREHELARLREREAQGRRDVTPTGSRYAASEAPPARQPAIVLGLVLLGTLLSVPQLFASAVAFAQYAGWIPSIEGIAAWTATAGVVGAVAGTILAYAIWPRERLGGGKPIQRLLSGIVFGLGGAFVVLLLALVAVG